MSDGKSFDEWAIVELMGHNQIAGHCTEEQIAGSTMLRVDVPPVKGFEAFTKWYGGTAIYAITPTTEEIARIAATQLRNRSPVQQWIIPMQRSFMIEPPEDDDIN